MSSLQQLVRLHRWTLDEKRRTLGELERLAERMTRDLAALDAEIARERAAAERSLEARRAYGAYLPVALERQRTLADSLAQVERQIETAREAVNAAFRDVKKYELALANAQRREDDRLRRRERIQLDELGLSSHRRREAEPE